MTESDVVSAARQKHPRVAVKVRARLTSIDPERDPSDGSAYFRFCDDTCGNLSLSGAQISAAEPFEVGKRVLVELELPESETFEAVARVAWSEVLVVDPELPLESGTGIEFTRISTTNRRILEAYVRAQLRRVRSRRAPHSGRSTVLRT